ncbi:hypothetical protein Pcac1_g18979 [Phytophthora cactorum]|uniref:Uncharacterized protein n=1 Tax=Phytophthora cactorum TaxID=29920 RepID=A0A8T1EZU3_9STRA|nr:hypothetical protein Pcac1_g18979 [Phytophthora cactorum]KAG2801376.1 hypothetical protein PC111_g19567 [Phytophthora cactorum]KAG2836143.1 hypothetical protein PC113_g20086 [Phytophthora cactorum]KAG2889349.1 hypothetical protein PC115_g19782 [Phytophthora cactorum]KAG2965040.1 hypothetical protein PC118_g19974 [Phytophthora cactorum]
MNAKIVSIKTTCDEGLVRLWCHLCWRLSRYDDTDERIVTEIDKIISSVKTNSVPSRNACMVISESDVSERVIQYFKLSRDIIDDHGWQ